MNPDLILALDVGISSARAALFDLAGRRVGLSNPEKYTAEVTTDGGSELEPGVVLRAVLHGIEQALHIHRTDPALRARPIAAVALSCFWHSLVGCDAKGISLTNIHTWQDSRAVEEAEKLRSRFDEKKMHARTGCMLRATFWPAKLRWIERTHHRRFSSVKRWMSPAEWLQFTLAGACTSSISMASGSGLLHRDKLTWDADLARFCETDLAHLPTISDEPTPIGGRLASQFPELRGVPWFPGIGEGAAAACGIGATRPGFAAIKFGANAALRVVRDARHGETPFGLTSYRIDAARCLVGGTVANAGNLREWCGRQLRLPDEAAIEAEFARHPGPDHGLIVLPFWSTERAPTWSEHASGTIHGLHQHTTAVEILQAVTEGTYYRLAELAEQLGAGNSETPKIIVGGSIERSPASLQRLSDVLGQTIYPSQVAEPLLRGAAVFAIEKLGYPAPDGEQKQGVRSRSKFVKVYAAQRARQRALEAALAACADA